MALGAATDPVLLRADHQGEQANELTDAQDLELLAEDSRNMICLTLELTAIHWDELQLLSLLERYP